MAEDSIIHLYRAVGYAEFCNLISTKKFSLRPNGLEAKYFGMNFTETLDFANRVFNIHVVAIIEVIANKQTIKEIGDFTRVDTTVFKSGTLEIDKVHLNRFNNSIIEIKHVY